MRKISTTTMIVLAFAIVVSSCKHAGLGQVPLDTDLANDGSVSEQQKRVDQYRLSLENQLLTRSGVSPEAQDLVKPQTRIHTDQARAYLLSVEDTRAKLDTPAIGFSRFVASDAFNASITLGFAVAGAVVAASAYGPTAATFFSSGGSNSDEALSAIGSVGLSMFWGAAVGVLGSIPLHALNSLLVVPFANSVAEADYQDAVAVYNKGLAKRVAQLAVEPQASSMQKISDESQENSAALRVGDDVAKQADR